MEDDAWHGYEKDGKVWNGMRWKDKDEPPDEDESWPKPYFLEEPGYPNPSHPLENHPDWPFVRDPEIEAYPYDDPWKDEDEPLVFDDMRKDPNEEDMTYLPPWIRKYIEPPTKYSIKKGEEEFFTKPCYIDDDPRNNWLYKEYHGPIINTIIRGEWGAEPWKPKRPLNVPVKHVRITYTGGETDNYPEAFRIIQQMQRDHKKQGLEDIAYNYVIGNDAAIYEGRGWYVDAERPEEFKHLKQDCLDIAYMGDFSNKDPPWLHLKSVMDVISYAVQIRVLDPNFKVIQYRPHNK